MFKAISSTRPRVFIKKPTEMQNRWLSLVTHLAIAYAGTTLAKVATKMTTIV